MSELSTTEHALLGAPHQYLTPLERPTLEEARAWCRKLARTHYENFQVATIFFLTRHGLTSRPSMPIAALRTTWEMRLRILR